MENHANNAPEGRGHDPDKKRREGSDQASVLTVHGQSCTHDAATRPVDPGTNVDIVRY